jgi:hypothetical protein
MCQIVFCACRAEKSNIFSNLLEVYYNAQGVKKHMEVKMHIKLCIDAQFYVHNSGGA